MMIWAGTRRTPPMERAPWAEPVAADDDGEPEVPIDALSPFFGPRKAINKYASYYRGEPVKPVKYPMGCSRANSFWLPRAMPFVLGLSGEDPMTATITTWSDGLAHLTGIPRSAVLGVRLSRLASFAASARSTSS